MTTLWTIGHSNHPIGSFTGLLQAAAIATLVDVRSHPASRFCPHFNRLALAEALAAAGIGYRWLGAALGGKPRGPALMRGRLPDYARMAATVEFSSGIKELIEIAEAGPAAIMCAEKNPLDCHRTHLVTPALAARGVEVVHLLADGTSLPHRELTLL